MTVVIKVSDLVKLVKSYEAYEAYKEAYEICEGALCSYRTIVSGLDLGEARKVLKEAGIKKND